MRALATTVVLFAVLTMSNGLVYAQGRGGQGPQATAMAAAPIDLTGYWVSVVTEDWRYRMVTPARGDYRGIPMTPEAAVVADGWDPDADQAAGMQCRSYGAGMIMRVPGRLRISWVDDETLQVEAETGTQTRTFRFGAMPAGERSWQGDSIAEWQPHRASGRERGRGVPRQPVNGSLKVVTTNLRPGYLRKNGVPYSENAIATDYYSVARLGAGVDVLVVTTVVDDPVYLTQPFTVSTQFKKEVDPTGWNPTPCSATW